MLYSKDILYITDSVVNEIKVSTLMELMFQWRERDNKHLTPPQKHRYVKNVISGHKYKEENKTREKWYSNYERREGTGRGDIWAKTERMRRQPHVDRGPGGDILKSSARQRRWREAKAANSNTCETGRRLKGGSRANYARQSGGQARMSAGRSKLGMSWGVWQVPHVYESSLLLFFLNFPRSLSKPWMTSKISPTDFTPYTLCHVFAFASPCTAPQCCITSASAPSPPSPWPRSSTDNWTGCRGKRQP